MIREIAMFLFGLAAGFILAAHTEAAYVTGAICIFLGAFFTILAENA